MSEPNFQTILKIEDLIFDLVSGSVSKKSLKFNQICKNAELGKIQNLKEFEDLTPIDGAITNRLEALKSKDDLEVRYELYLGETRFMVTEFCWINRLTNTLNISLFFKSYDNYFLINESSVLDVLDKVNNPAIIFSLNLDKVIAVNQYLLEILNQPISTIGNGFDLEDFFISKQAYSEILAWVKDKSENVLKINANLNLNGHQGSWFELNLLKIQLEKGSWIFCSLRDQNHFVLTEKRLNRFIELQSSVVEVQSHFLAQAPEANSYELLLNHILKVINANIGFIGKLESESPEDRYLQIHAASDFSKDSEDAKKLYQDHFKNNFKFRHFDNLFGACITSGKIILENNPPTNPHTKGNTVLGHPMINSFLGLPILKGNKVIGLIGLANKENGFNENDIDDLKPFVSTYSVILESLEQKKQKIKFEKESLQKAEILSIVADHSPDLIVVMNDAFEFEFFSPSNSSFYIKESQEDSIKRKIRYLIKKTLQKKYLKENENYRSRLKVKLNNKKEFWLETSLNTLQDERGRKLIAVIRDVSLQFQLEKNLKTSLKKEIEFNSFVSDFLSIVSHEFKTPMATILSSLDLSNYYLEEVNAPDSKTVQLRNHLKKIEKEVKQLHLLVENSLDYERFVGNRAAKKVENLNLASFMEEIINQNEFQDKFDYINELESGVQVSWDKFMMTTGILNLLKNAIKYGNPLKKSKIRLFRDPIYFGIEVEDFGIGIPSQDLPFIFTPYFRSSNALHKEGTGLGLVAVKNFVNMHDGEIIIISIEGLGTKARIQFKMN